jgi:hypothetical protein
VSERSTDEPRQPRSEPEVIPPDRSGDRRAEPRPFRRADDVRIVFGARGNRYVIRPGPFAIVMAALALSAVGVALLVFLLGAFLIALPLIGALAAAFLLGGLIRFYARRLR